MFCFAEHLRLIYKYNEVNGDQHDQVPIPLHCMETNSAILLNILLHRRT